MACNDMLEIVAQVQSNPVLAMEHYEKVRIYAKQNNEKFLYCQAVGNMADIYSNLNCYDKAVDMYRDCLEEMKGLGRFDANQENLFCKLLAGYGDCLLMTGCMEEALAVAKEVEQLICEKSHTASVELAASVFLTHWAERNDMKAETTKYLEQAVGVVLQNEEVIADSEQILKMIQCLIGGKRFEQLRNVLEWTEPRAAMAEKETFLLQLLLYRLQYCSDDMSPEEFHKSVEDFFSLKSRYEYAENSQILQMTKLRDKLKEIEEEQVKLMEEKTKLIYRTQHDELSGLYNKRHLNRYMEELFEEAMEKGLPLGVMFLDIDYFKQMNDRYGHQKGDECIIAISDAINTCMPGDFAARYGGDEFVILTIGRTREYMEARAQMLVDNIKGRKIPNVDSPYMSIVTITIGGVHAIPHRPNKMWDFLTVADETLYQQKKEQKGFVRFYEVEEDGL